MSDYSLDVPYGGVQTHLYHLARSISRNSVETHIILFSDRNKDIKVDNLKIHLIKRSSRLPRLFTIPFDAKNAINKIKEINPDIVHVQGTHYPYNYISIALLGKYPVLITVHGLMATEYKYESGINFLSAFISYLLEKYALSKIKDIIVLAPQIEQIIRKMTDSKTYIIPNGVDCDETDDIRTFKAIKHPSMIYMGVLENVKGVDVLIKAVKTIKSDVPDIHLYVAGQGFQEENLKKLTKKLDLDGNIDFLGYISGEEKYSLMKSANVLVLPSLWESLPIAVLEGMACGKPIIASNVGGVPYLVDDGVNGFLVQPGEVNELADKIITLLKDKKLQEAMGRESLNRSEDFEWNKIAEKTIDLYKEILKRSISYSIK